MTSPAVRRPSAHRLPGTSSGPFDACPPRSGETQLTAREEQILAFVAEGASHKEIAASLRLSTHTISNHIKNIYAKLHVNRRGDALRKARLLGYLEDPPKP